MSGNTFGKVFTFTSWGESHGEAIGCVIDGVPSGIELSEADIQPYLNKRKPGQSEFTTPRNEDDEIKILSGVFDGKTTGTPISLIIYNKNQKSKDYTEIASKFRPGHADFTYMQKYGIRDYRGGGRSSARETAMRVAAGAIARKILGNDVKIRGALIQLGTKTIDAKNWNWEEVSKNPFNCPDKEAVPVWSEYLKGIMTEGSSVGAVIKLEATGVPVGLGEPVYDKLSADIAKYIMSINAVKGVEIGAGFHAASLRGEENADEMINDGGETKFLSNNAGGILGGISTGMPITVRFAVKPTSSILIPKKTVDTNGNNCEIITQGRHDPCVGIRAVPVGEAMLACTLADHFLINKIASFNAAMSQ